MENRIITTFSTKGGKQKFTTDVKTWGELKNLLKEHYDLNNLQGVENIYKTTLIHKDAVLPERDFILFLRPIKTKSGSSNYNSEEILLVKLKKIVSKATIKIDKLIKNYENQDLKDEYNELEKGFE